MASARFDDVFVLHAHLTHVTHSDTLRVSQLQQDKTHWCFLPRLIVFIFKKKTHKFQTTNTFSTLLAWFVESRSVEEQS